MQKFVSVDLAFLLAILAPFINATFEFNFGFPVYAVIACLLFLIALRAALQRFSPAPVETYLINLFFILLFLVFGPKSGVYELSAYCIIIAAVMLISKTDYGHPKRLPVNELIVVVALVFFLELSGLSRNIVNMSRGGVEGSILGLSVIFGAVSVGAICSYVEEKRSSMLLLWLISLLLIGVVMKTKGALLAAVLVNLLAVRKNAVLLASVACVAPAMLVVLFRLRGGSNSTSTDERLRVYQESFHLVGDRIFDVSLAHNYTFKFHNWIMELAYLLGPTSIILLPITLLLLGYVFFLKAHSLYGSLGIYFCIVGLFSFEAVTVAYAVVLCVTLHLAASRQWARSNGES